MKNILILICAIVFLTTGLASAVHAAVPDMSCSYDVVDLDDSKQDCTDGQKQEKSDLKKCHDCCFHCHVFAGVLTDNSIKIIIKNGMALTLHASLRSNDHSPLYRPPKA